MHPCVLHRAATRSGLFYLHANERTLDLLQRLDKRLSEKQYWDQTAYNEEIFFLSHGSYKSPQVSVRVMDIDQFMNSKRLFKDVRKRSRDQQPAKPVMVHVNYHPGGCGCAPARSAAVRLSRVLVLGLLPVVVACAFWV